MQTPGGKQVSPGTIIHKGDIDKVATVSDDFKGSFSAPVNKPRNEVGVTRAPDEMGAQRNRAAAVFIAMLTVALAVSAWFQLRLDRNLRMTRAVALANVAEREMVKDQVFGLHLALEAVRA